MLGTTGTKLHLDLMIGLQVNFRCFKNTFLNLGDIDFSVGC